ncbi:tagaturonate reductase [Rhodocaloribacter litoris]|uniref:tagaturonate reductase n=1 Tax=Rhodocaloribacter litoris TaxID=2558931 RepID=UPI001423C2BE|nr:tagaturonate reductase [Rhodocaloribacter litoris]QXD14453.1 tagaturonate reductase [Rhodocaloribacter litoris]
MALPDLNRHTARQRGQEPLAALPERVLQFGTGAFLRGFAGYFVDRANEAGRLNGRIVMVGSTGSGRVQRLAAQDGLYTLLVRGREHGEVVDRAHLITAVGRVLSARDRWAEVLEVARHPDLALVVSNTTEVGITLDEDDRIDRNPPRSFPGKLTAVLYERARAFDFDPARGLLILPCELVDDNGDRLREIVQALAARWKLPPAFLAWLDASCRFCNTLVDRIVPGTPPEEEAAAFYERLGYRDELLTVAEPYRLWAIEGDDEVRERLPLAGTDAGIVVAGDITPYRLLKVRILNGAHTISVPAALLCGLETVCEAVGHPLVGRFIQRLVRDEIAPGLDLPEDLVTPFAEAVLERFANPFIRHALRDITFQQTMKMRVRVVPSIEAYAARFGEAPPSLAFGFACFLLFQHPCFRPDGPWPEDEAAPYWQARWQGVAPDDAEALVQRAADVLADAGRWGLQLRAVPGFERHVAVHLRRALREGVPAALAAHLDEVGSRS